MTDTGFAVEMERKAREFIDRLIAERVLSGDLYRDDRNFKPWYSPRGVIDEGVGGVGCVLIGVNPGGCPGEHDPTTNERRWERSMDDDHPFNAYIDEKWERKKMGEAPLQRAVQKVFKALYRDERKSKLKLRNTVCFNVCPIRTHDTSCIPEGLWKESVDWCLEVLERLKPKHVICIGNGEETKSPWAAMKRKNGFKELHEPSWKIGKVRLKYGEFNTETLARTSVIGLRHLSYEEYVPTTIKLLNRHRHEMKLPESVRC